MSIEISYLEQTKRGYVSYKTINDIVDRYGFPSERIDVYDSRYGIYLFTLVMYFCDGIHVVNAHVDHKTSDRVTYLEYDSDKKIIRKSYGRILF